MSGGYFSYFANSQNFSDAALQNLLPDLQSQVANEFNYYWGMYAYLDDSGTGNPVFIVDSTNYPNPPAGALGFHAIDQNYNPFAVVFADLCVAYGVPVTGVISHETLEMLADPLTDVAALYPNVSDYSNYTGDGFIVLQEVCDPVEMLLYYEAPNGNIVSDFITPQWYAPAGPGAPGAPGAPSAPGPFDFLGAISAPWQLASGGYVCYQEIYLPGWICPTGDEARQAAATAGERVARVDNPLAGAISRRLSKGMRIEAPPTREVTVVKRKDVPKVGGSGRTSQGRPQLPVAATPVKAQKIPDKV
jgi:hypothetical protein